MESTEQEYQELGPGSQTLVRFYGRVQNQDESVGPTELQESLGCRVGTDWRAESGSRCQDGPVTGCR